jgi:hypothetical protein
MKAGYYHSSLSFTGCSDTVEGVCESKAFHVRCFLSFTFAEPRVLLGVYIASYPLACWRDYICSIDL